MRGHQLRDTKTISVIENLLNVVGDGRDGFADAAEKLEDAGEEYLAAQMRRFSQQRLRLSNELKAVAGSRGGSPIANGNGSLAGAVHRGWMGLRDALSGDDPQPVLAAAEQGESHAVDEYERALETDLPTEVRSLVERQLDEIKTTHDRMRTLSARHG